MTTEAANVAGDLDVDRLIEAFTYAIDNFSTDWSFLGGVASSTYSGGPTATISQRAFSTLDDRADGRYRPFYHNEFDLSRQRSMARNLAAFTSVSVGALQSLQVYVMAGEWRYEVQEKPLAEAGETTQQLVAAVQRVVDDFLEHNEWIGDFDREIHDVAREDGETLVALYPSHGVTDARRIEVDALREPAGKERLERWLQLPRWARPGKEYSSWTFGVHTIWDPRMGRIDHTRHAGYHVVFDDGGQDWDYLPSTPQPHQGGKCAVMLRRNVIRTAKRGVSDFWPVQIDLEREDKLSENISVGAAVQAAIAYIRQHPKGTTSADASSNINDALDTFSQRLSSSRSPNTRKVERLNPGSVVDIPSGKEYKPGPASTGTAAFLEVSQALKRRIGIRWLFPEYMISGDASNANFASTLVAESPFVKARESDQNQYAVAFRRIVWRAVKIEHDKGRFSRFVSSWAELESLVELLVTPPPVATRDKAQHVAELTALFDRKIMTANEVRLETRREELPELEGVTGSGQTQPGMMAFGDSQTGDSQQRAVSAALESVETTDEARAILEGMGRGDP